MKISNLIIVLILIVAAFGIGFLVGFSYIGDSPAGLFDPETWRTFIHRLRSF
ncbi:DNA-directed RNA polymerase subunit beta [Natranaerobius thermophilus]|uniref:DNA-directed RNA polymerase subunit beta n=1 Tax=Natranaerobius thermophilus (strain ATCC BAA-1301 / DSM 18059 / JW/NM-WN-LF) TaxID=457570 RepID=B2A4J9_NATTJ|nr:DNA-directed RNA polymerase subunit beta [Natranaerobius thermophilus]ACB85176.1 hypothetical protein Nther_1602 [Natranaerobius thermophilus JW/NM-WN-LF]